MKKLCIFLVLSLCCLANAYAHDVIFNIKSHKYHNPECVRAHKCTKNCITIDSAEAESLGGIPCKVCGG
ncbi:MAG: hypothetical protein LBB23_04650 [Rickettsiales bacterium]|nr:hypothetical protein [Rickettsiales bacterium]